MELTQSASKDWDATAIDLNTQRRYSRHLTRESTGGNHSHQLEATTVI